MGLVAITRTPEEREQLDALTAHQKSVREHKKTEAAKKALAEALADAQIEHANAGSARAEAKTTLLASLQDA